MSNRICFASETGEDISKITVPSDLIIEGGWRYEPERNCIFTMVKVTEVHDDTNWIERAEKWAKSHNLLVTSDYELKKV